MSAGVLPHSSAGEPDGRFAERLRAARARVGLTQAELALRAGVGVRTVRDLEQARARPQRSTAELLAGALGLREPDRGDFLAAAGRGEAPLVGEVLPAATAELDRIEDAARSGLGLLRLAPPTELIGRDAELARLDVALQQAGLITLVGVAGVGKTSLAVAGAHRVATRHPGGVAGFSLSEVSSSAAILATTAAVLGAPRASDLVGRIGDQPALLVLDAVEAAPGEAATAVTWLRQQVPSLRILATGRHGLSVAGEYVWPVTPLETPPPGLDRLASVTRYPAAELFLTRLRQVREVEVGDNEAGVLGELVRRLGGLPLALELVASRGRVLTLRQTLERYGSRVLDLATGTSAGTGAPIAGPATGDAAPGVVTLRAALEASYRLLEPSEQSALRALAAFHHRWSVELAEPVLAARPGVEPGEDPVTVLDRIAGLGLVSVRGSGSLRFRVLDTVREFAIEQAEELGESEQLRLAHARVIAGYVSRVAPRLEGASLGHAVEALDEVVADIEAALRFSADHEPHTALGMAAQLPRWWHFRGYDRHGREWLRRLLDLPANATAEPLVRAWAMVGLVQLASQHGDGPIELGAAADALTIFAKHGDIAGELAAHTQLGAVYQAAGSHNAARRHADAALALASAHGRTRDIIVAQNQLTWHDVRLGRLDSAAGRQQEVTRLATELGDERLLLLAQGELAEIARLAGRFGQAVEAGRRVAAGLERFGDPAQRRRVLGTVALALAQSGQVEFAGALLDQLTEPGTQAMVQAYLAAAVGDRQAAAAAYGAAADALAGRLDVRDAVEALVRAIEYEVDLNRRTEHLTALSRTCRRGAIKLLPGERDILDAARTMVTADATRPQEPLVLAELELSSQPELPAPSAVPPVEPVPLDPAAPADLPDAASPYAGPAAHSPTHAAPATDAVATSGEIADLAQPEVVVEPTALLPTIPPSAVSSDGDPASIPLEATAQLATVPAGAALLAGGSGAPEVDPEPVPPGLVAVPVPRPASAEFEPGGDRESGPTPAGTVPHQDPWRSTVDLAEAQAGSLPADETT